jgi:cytochrome P450
VAALPRIQDFDDPNFDAFLETRPFGPVDFWKLQLEAWERNGPVQPGNTRSLAAQGPDPSLLEGQETFMIFGTERTRRMLNDPQTFNHELFRRGFEAAFGHSLTAMDPPEHTRYRRIFQKVFLPNAIAEWSSHLIAPAINDLIKEIKPLHKCELVEAFTFPYPFEIIFRQLKLPVEDRRTFHRLSVAQGLFMNDLPKAIEAGRKLGAYFQALLEERRRNPGGDDLVTRLAHAEDNGERLPDDVIIAFLRQLMNAAGDTTYRSTSSMLVLLLRDRPDQYALLVNDRSLVPAAIEETLRLYTPVGSSHLTVTRDIEIEGVKIPKGAIVVLAPGLMGRDPALFENPHQFDIARPHPERHWGFSNGPHICLGQHLARLEMNRALNALLDHFPNMRLDPDYPPPQICGEQLQGPRELHVLLD